MAPQFLTLPQARDLLEAYRFNPRDAEQYVAMALAAGRVRSTQPGAGPLLYFPNGFGIELSELEMWIPRAPIVNFGQSTILIPHRDANGLLCFVAAMVKISHLCLQKLLIETVVFENLQSENINTIPGGEPQEHIARQAVPMTSGKKAESACAVWIAEIAKVRKRAKKEAIKLEAKEKFGSDLSEEAFNRAWASAAPQEWKQAGRPPKS